MSQTRSDEVTEQATPQSPVQRSGLFSSATQADAPHPQAGTAQDGAQSDSWRAMPFGTGPNESAGQHRAADERDAQPRPEPVGPPFPVTQ